LQLKPAGIFEFVELIDEEAGEPWAALDDFAPDRNYMSPSDFLRAVHALGFKRTAGGES
jgi:hypothetical protein